MRPNDIATKAREAEQVTEAYYDSDPADRFYSTVWGGEDIHIGLYFSHSDTVAEASRRTVDRMAGYLDKPGPTTRIMDLGAGYGGSGRFLAKTFGCHVDCLNLSEVQNRRNRQMNKEQGLSDKVGVVYGSFDDVPAEDAGYDKVWSQDAFLHSGQRDKAFAEAWRILKPGGELIFTDPMQADDCPPGVLQPVYDRLHLQSLGSIQFYREQAAKLGMTEVRVDVLTEHLRHHYARVAQILRQRYDEMIHISTKEYVDRMLVGLDNWVKAADNGYLAWGILQFRK